jgi:hypothetical protein
MVKNWVITMRHVEMLSHHQNGVSIQTSIFFLILDPSMSLNWAHSIYSWCIDRTISWANSSPPELIPNSAPISFNSANCHSFRNVGLLKVVLFLRLRAFATTFAFSWWYSMVQSWSLLSSIHLFCHIFNSFCDIKYFKLLCSIKIWF